MKLVTILLNGERFAGILEGDDVFVSDVPDMATMIREAIDLKERPGRWAKRRDLTLDVPIRPGAVLGTGSNYRDHLEERIPASDGMNAPKRELEFFVKTGLTVAAPDVPFKLEPALGSKIDQETELAIVMGNGCPRGVSEDQALNHVYGYMVANDLTARDKQVRLLPDGSNFMVLGASKNFEGATRFSDHLVTADEIPDVYDLGLRTYLNGELKQNNSTSNLINSFARIVSFFSEVLTLQPGTVIITGTPGGTGWGQDAELGGKAYVPPECTPNRYLRPGDEVRSVIDGLGELRFAVE
ncbi:fumarylacetoacetate hydrolase family protein [Sphingobium sp. Sx8-8]|uniref:fumarylacetoacetate hydrolase family protein n=1 Tax=Sphingobium sp. Sx8-8 TaxID=2933617 RepID=UPI001F575CDA|nr:fumarylacetoacetate hydrolase family protein [Sphingobium sp. Sx8-8]